jgi:uncharacterized repeat protein (TIGR03943 family)
MPNNQEDFIPVYLFVGFLEAGKTKFIQEALEDNQFDTNGKMLLLVCEEGIEEYDTSKFDKDKVEMRVIEDEADFNPDNLSRLLNETGAKVVMIEHNGMWMLNKFFEQVPEDWAIFQCVLIADASTIFQYNSNMRGLVAEKLNMAELVMFNRFDPSTMNPNDFHQLVRGVNRKSAIYYELTDGRMMQDDIPDPLPFDVNADNIVIKDEDFALFFSDLMEEPKKYKGKRVTFRGFAHRNASFPKNTFAVGRHIMTCCVEDIQYYWLEVRHDKSIESKNKQWIMITAKIDIVQKMLQRKAMPVLIAETVANADPPEQEVCTFY